MSTIEHPDTGPDISAEAPEAAAATTAAADAPAKRGRGRPRKHPIAAPATQRPETAQPLAAEAAQAEPIEQATQPQPVAAVTPESAVDRRWRLRRDIEAAERDASGIRTELVALAVECEAGNPKALARRAALREQLAAVADRIGDKQAALAATLPLAEAHIAKERRERRERAFAEAERLLDWWTAWAEEADRALLRFAAAMKHCATLEGHVLSATQAYVPQGSHWLFGIDADLLADTIVARLVRLEVLSPKALPGPMHDGRTTLSGLVRQHAGQAKLRLAAIQREEERRGTVAVMEAPPPPFAGSSAEPWRHRAVRVDPLIDRLSGPAGHAD
jgi:hypothetical protein